MLQVNAEDSVINILEEANIVEEEGDISKGVWKICIKNSIQEAQDFIGEDLRQVQSYPFWQKNISTKNGLLFWNDEDDSISLERKGWPEHSKKEVFERVRGKLGNFNRSEENAPGAAAPLDVNEQSQIRVSVI